MAPSRNPRVHVHVHVHVGDAFQLVRRLEGRFDVVIADFPDPATAPLARLYSVTFYGRLLLP